MVALERLKARRAAGSCATVPATAGHAASTTHHANDAYLAAFDGPEHQREQPLIFSHGFNDLAAPAVRPAAAPVPPGPAAPSAWWQPPAAPSAISLTDRSVLCASVDWGRQEAVLGTADHALYSVDLRRRRKARTLYSRAAGHSEWVSAVCHLPDGRIASGGMDSQVWLWPCSASRPRLLEGHAASVSALAPVPAAPTRLLSAGYDKRVLCWDCRDAASQPTALGAHRAPVLQLAAAAGWAASGDRDGCLARWDVAAGRALGGLVQAHAGHCTALAWWGTGGSSSSEGRSSSSGAGGSCSADGRVLLSGGQDGAVKLWDARCRQQAAVAAHADPAGRGAVGSIACWGHLVLTCGANATVCGLDMRSGLDPAWDPVQLPDFPYSAAVSGPVVLVGCGDGSILGVDIPSGRLSWSVRTAGSAVRTLDASENLLIAGCSDGSVLLFDPA